MEGCEPKPPSRRCLGLWCPSSLLRRYISFSPSSFSSCCAASFWRHPGRFPNRQRFQLMFELIVAISILLSLILYALTGGADFGGGMWDLLAVGPRAVRQRQAITEAIGPIWEANHVWLILVVVLLFTGFPAK